MNHRVHEAQSNQPRCPLWLRPSVSGHRQCGLRDWQLLARDGSETRARGGLTRFHRLDRPAVADAIQRECPLMRVFSRLPAADFRDVTHVSAAPRCRATPGARDVAAVELDVLLLEL